MVAYGAFNAWDEQSRSASKVFAAANSARRLWGTAFLIVSRNDMPSNGLDHNLVFVSGHGAGAPPKSIHDRGRPHTGMATICSAPCRLREFARLCLGLVLLQPRRSVCCCVCVHTVTSARASVLGAEHGSTQLACSCSS